MQDEPSTQPSFPGAAEPHHQQYDVDPSSGYQVYQSPPTPPIPPVPPSRAHGSGRGFWGRRNRWLVAIGAALALAIAIAGGVAFAAHQNTPSTAASPPASVNIPAPQKQNTVYTVVSVSGTTISATQGSGASASAGSSVTITTSAKTKITRGGQPASLSDLTAGTKFRVRGKAQSGGSIAAERIEIVLPAVKGAITAINGDTLTIQTRKKTITVRLTPSTTIVDATTHARATPSSLAVGEMVTIQGLPNGDGTYTALRILAGTPTRHPATGTPTATGTPAA
ncbi:MAG TPA: DUF5666 domain-containing protein [Ktedonobacterales bacterium]